MLDEGIIIIKGRYTKLLQLQQITFSLSPHMLGRTSANLLDQLMHVLKPHSKYEELLCPPPKTKF